ncbi:MAG: dihydrodipicolinate synthase family protein [Pyrinomonadaceae bacterium]|nr:dihydrodipicolinate synthase family protein [Pyrinomonadaceae bacterium]
MLTSSSDCEIRKTLLRGVVIPAHPLVLTAERKLDERRQIALSRYYCDAGVGGIAVGVHTTQFAIRDPKHNLFEWVLRLGVATMREHEQASGKRLVKVAGVCGPTGQAVQEAVRAREIGYDAGLLSLAALGEASTTELIEHCRRVAAVIPLFGFYLQPAVGGRLLDYQFWREFLEIENVVAVKVAAFNRYHTLDVARALAESGRSTDVALYTGNDDNIVADLLTEFRFAEAGETVAVHFAGGLLGHWAVWTRRAVELLDAVRECKRLGGRNAFALLAQSAEITDVNAAFFDAKNNFAGCIAGLHEVLRRQGLMTSRSCLDPHEDLSPGQMEEIDRVYACYPHLNDDGFVAQYLEHWLR